MSIFAAAELGHSLSKKEYDEEEPRLREQLLAAQVEALKSAKFALLILVSGVDGAGKGEVVNLLNEWLDPRHVRTAGFAAPSEDEAARPPMWRYWRRLPPKGKIGVFFGSWYTQPILDHASGEIGDGAFERALDDIVTTEKMLADEGIVLVKLWFHLSKKAQKKRLKALEKERATRWRVTREDWRRFERYDDLRTSSERALRVTSRQHAPWHVIEGSDAQYRAIAAGRLVLESLTQALARKDEADPRVDPPPSISAIDRKRVTGAIDLSRKLDDDEYDDALAKLQGRLGQLARKARFRKHSLVCVFEGADAAGKGGAIRRVTRALDARFYEVVPIAAPSDEERAQPYLWRFWRNLPARGRVTIFDRSWYGRVLVERVEGFATTYDWTRAYAEINDFEEQLVRHGAVVVKLWLQISQEEQLRRFKARQETPHKRFKIGPEDWRNREKWDQYDDAVCDMVDRTSTEIAPWTLISAEDKKWARVEVLRTIVERLEEAL